MPRSLPTKKLLHLLRRATFAPLGTHNLPLPSPASASASGGPPVAPAAQYIPLDDSGTLVFLEGENFTTSGAWEARECEYENC